MNDGGGVGGGWLIHIRVWVGEDRGWVLSDSFFYVLLPFGLSCPVSFLSEQSIIAVVSVSLFIICFLCLRSH